MEEQITDGLIDAETEAWLADKLACRFEFIFTLNYGSWLNLVEGFFPKLARYVLRHIRASSEQDDRLMAADGFLTATPSCIPGQARQSRAI